MAVEMIVEAAERQFNGDDMHATRIG